MRTLLVVLVMLGCKGSDKQAPPQPRVSTFEPLPAAPTATIDPPDAKAEFPNEQPVLAMWSGGGEPPRTAMSMRVWADGSVRFRCGRRGKLAPERVTAMVASFEKRGWMPSPGEGIVQLRDSEASCVKTVIQLGGKGSIKRHESECNGALSPELQDAIEFVFAVVGPDPCT